MRISFSLILAANFLAWLLVGSVLAGQVPLPPSLPSLEKPNPDLVELGRQLFFDRRLSGDGTLSCAVCHIPEQAYSDGRKISTAYPTNKHWRNTLSLLNVVYLEKLFWDGRGTNLDEQALGPIHAPFEMNLNPDYLAAKLEEIPGYRQQFSQVWQDGEINQERISAALAAFERTLVCNDSPFDRYLAGDQGALSADARKGLEIFFGERGQCANCHSGSLLSDQQFHNLGVAELPELLSDPQHRATRRFVLSQVGLGMLERDPGRYLVSRQPKDMGAFRTAPLRQIQETGPYMHNGSLDSLESVIDFYDRGGGSDSDRSHLLQPLDLSRDEKQALLAFLRNLSGTYPVVRPPELP